MLHQFSRNELVYGKEGTELLKNSTVVVLGIGGVGSFAVEALARTGVGKLILIDKDVVDITNVNRQIHATLQTVGRSKVEVMAERIASINPHCEVVQMHMFYNEETAPTLFEHKIDFIVDASDTISFKIHLIKECLKRNIKFISSMGAANKLDPTKFEIVDLSKTSYDPVAKVIRTKLKKEKINGKIPVIYSTERPIIGRIDTLEVVGNSDSEFRKQQLPPASNAFVPSVAGLIAASYVVRELTKSIPVKRKGDN
ncbi:MAG TPA: tRNA threonylcarbamoyladenosine dehydratase [Firmicutes bacterium]|nr:tRNA threonylcarbamoyladenosine dehydratase [Bacillota bacterium]